MHNFVCGIKVTFNKNTIFWNKKKFKFVKKLVAIKINEINFKRIAYHILFWGVITFFYDSIISFISETPFFHTLLHDLKYYTPTDILGVYFMLYFLIPKFLLKKKYIAFSIYSTIFFVILILVVTLPFQYLGHFMDYRIHYLSEGKPFPSFSHFFLKNIIPTMTVKLMIIGIASSIKIAKIWIISQKRQQNLIKEKLEINLRLKESELKHLKSQLNPHFLFNALNNLYSLTLEGSSKAPEVVLKISSLLDYVLYQCDGPTVDLDTEIENVKNYIDLQKIRYGEDTNIELIIKGNPCGISIAPLLIIPLVENAFKHGLDKDVGKGFVKIIIEINKEDDFVVYVENSLKGENNHEGEGIGLNNLKKRLELQYPQKYSFIVNNNDVVYSTKLSIELA